MEKRSDFIIEKQRIAIAFHMMQIGSDYLIVIEGGDRPHIGAVSAGVEEGRQQICLPGHKEAAITEAMCRRLTALCQQTVCVVGGVHIDGITKQQIALVLDICEEAGKRLGEILLDWKRSGW